MAIVREVVTNYSGLATVHTFAHETKRYYRGLIVNVFDMGATGNVPISVTFDGVPMTYVIGTASSGYQYYLANPSSGTKNIVVTFSTGVNVYIAAVSYSNVSQSAMLNTFNSDSNTASSINVAISPTVADCWAVTLGWDTSETVSNSTFYTIIDNLVYSRVRLGDSNGSVPSGATSVRVQSASSSFTVYGSVLVIAPELAVPLLNTTTYDNLAQTSVMLLSEVLYDADASVTERGFVYDTTTLPTTTDSKKVVAGTVGSYTADITGLSVNTTYYARAYAINANGTAYSNEVTFTTLNIPQYELQKDIGATDGQTFIGRINVTGTVGTITVQLGSTGTSTVIAAGAGPTTFSGTYSGLSGLIITRSATFNGTIDDVFYAQVPLGTTIDFSLDAVTIITAIDGSVFFKRIEEKVFNSFAFYRYLDVLFKDLDGFVTVTVRSEREDDSTEISKTFSVGNPNSGTVSPFQKKRISFLIKDQAVIIGFSNANIGETFSLAQFLLTGYKKPEKLFSPGKIISMS